MSEHRPEVADVIRDYGEGCLDLDRLTGEQRRVLRDLARCRTAALGGHGRVCDHCGHVQIAYNSCRNRHCPKCQGPARRRWLEARATDLLEVGYFHVVFTLPHELSALARRQRRIVYGLFFQAVARTLLQVAQDPRHLGAQIGFLAVLHTWGQKLTHHPHIHCVVPGGGLSADGTHWIPCRPSFFLPVKVLSRLLRGKMLAYLQQAVDQHALDRDPLCADPAAWRQLRHDLARKEWAVYAKPPFGGPHQVLKYLARYTHRVAIANSRLLGVQDGQVTFRWKDYADRGRQKPMTLDAAAFLRRFLLHLLPSGFVHMRYYGWLSHRVRRQQLSRCRRLLAQQSAPTRTPASNAGLLTDPAPSGDDNLWRCPACGQGRMVLVTHFDPDPCAPGAGIFPPREHDTS